MEKTSKKSFFRKNISILLLIIIVVICLGFSALKTFGKLESRLYDVLLGLSAEPEVSPRIVLVDIDDRSLNEVGTWPWTRDILGTVLLRLGELGADTAIFDIEYLSPSAVTVADNIGELTQSAFISGQEDIAWMVDSFAEAIADGSVPARSARQAGAELVDGGISPVLGSMYQQIYDGLNRDNDDYFARTVQFFGNTFLTINTRDTQVEVLPEDAAYAARRFLLTGVEDPAGLIAAGNDYSALEEGSDVQRGFVPAIHKIISHAAGAGFTNVVVDKDGTRRRVELLSELDGAYAAQLAFAPLLKLIDAQGLRRTARTLTIQGALLPGATERTDIRIPLDAHGRLLVNWLRGMYVESFKHVGVYNFLYMDESEADIYAALTALLAADMDGMAPEDEEFVLNARYLTEEYDAIRAQLQGLLARCDGFAEDGTATGGGLSAEDYESYYALRADYFENVQAFAASLSESISGSPVDALIEALSDAITLYAENSGLMRQMLQGGFCIIGNSATGSTDLGVTPFQKRYANLGTHANVANTILQQDFITPVDEWVGILCAAAFALVILLLTASRSATQKSVLGMLFVIVPVAAIVLLMVTRKIYVPLFLPALTVVAAWLAQAVVNFIAVERDKQLLRRGMDSYVSPDVVAEIVKNPSLMQLGGVNKNMTALFSDVRSFSAFTECVNVAEEAAGRSGAVRLVNILNGYLGVLSDAIMDQRGTIDKYVGDEIVSFFGAPIDNPNHAFDGCVAGIRMKQAEDRYNEEHFAELPMHPVTKTPFLLKSRVGLNTGDMVVGNMGTAKKLNYTIMGNNVNLASRLEGTAKEYDSWVIVSERTWQEANSGDKAGLLVSRQLDCVKVINVEKPVRIYSVVGLRNELRPEQIEAAEIFNQGMEWYLRGWETPNEPKDMEDFKKAISFFEKAYACYHETDPQYHAFISPEKRMIGRCNEFLAQGTLNRWDGVYTMKSK